MPAESPAASIATNSADLAAREAVLRSAARSDMAKAMKTADGPFEAAAAVCEGWSTRAIELGWRLDARAKMTGWLMDVLVTDLVQFVAEHLPATA